ncbi:hypothetical protein [Winogradskyella sp. MH6]|uniref:hypothetical protein n=1 Tax=Winogradskyella sp. MH6 TaxID=2929510 RepID=UPI001FB33976|nr:hypothetical protein [Winogradskyella sp. MH6]
MKRNISRIIGVGIIMLTLSCKTYTIPVESFKEQMKNTNSSNMKDVTVNNPLTYGSISYSANNIDRIIVVDKNGNSSYLNNSGSIEMRVTHKNGKKYHMYFDTVILENDTLKGGRSRFVQSLERQIPIDSIVKIEIQDGGKKFNYQN